MQAEPLLSGMRVIDMSDGIGELCGRFLADFGADVVLVEPPDGARSRLATPRVGDSSVHFVTHHANKRSIVLDLQTAADRASLLDLLGGADLWIETTTPGALERLGLAPHTVLGTHPHLVIVSITGFGQSGPYRDYAATEETQTAMCGLLSRSGLPERPPLLPPHGMLDDSVALQAAWAAMLAYWNARTTGHGDHVDVSFMETAAQVIDPAMGAVGSAAAGASGFAVPRGRPPGGFYPIFATADGYVRLVVLAVRQWHALRAWLGEPDDLQDPALDSVFGRMMAADRINAAVRELFARSTSMALVEEGQRRGVALAPILGLPEVLSSTHFAERCALVEHVLDSGERAILVNGCVDVDRVRAGIRSPAPEPGEHTKIVLDEAGTIRRPSPTGARPGARAPLAGMRVLDLGIIVMGAEAGRLFADQGAEVIKIENRAYPDGARAAIVGSMTASFAAGHRNKLGMGINLRHEEGRKLFLRLVAESDLVLENFKPGTLDSLGIGWDVLHSVNPRLVLGSCSAMGSTGPWRSWLGYGPLVRCVSGLTELWSYPGEPGSFSDGSTIFPDHLAARVVDTAALAALLRARETGIGAHVEVAQSEVILAVLADQLLYASLAPDRSGPGCYPRGAPAGVYPCAGDDEWCVVVVRDDDDWTRVVTALGRPAWALDDDLTTEAGRVARRDEIDHHLGAWTADRTNREVTSALQQAGVPAGFMQRVTEYVDDPHYVARSFFRVMQQPGVDEPIVVENAPAHTLGVAEPELGPAPLLGEHTRAICRDVLGMADDEIEAAFAAGALEETVAP